MISWSTNSNIDRHTEHRRPIQKQSKAITMPFREKSRQRSQSAKRSSSRGPDNNSSFAMKLSRSNSNTANHGHGGGGGERMGRHAQQHSIPNAPSRRGRSSTRRTSAEYKADQQQQPKGGIGSKLFSMLGRNKSKQQHQQHQQSQPHDNNNITTQPLKDNHNNPGGYHQVATVNKGSTKRGKSMPSRITSLRKSHRQSINSSGNSNNMNNMQSAWIYDSASVLGE